MAFPRCEFFNKRNIPRLLSQFPQLVSLNLINHHSSAWLRVWNFGLSEDSSGRASCILSPRWKFWKVLCCFATEPSDKALPALWPFKLTIFQYFFGNIWLIKLAVAHYDGMTFQTLLRNVLDWRRWRCDAFANFHLFPHSLINLSLFLVKFPQSATTKLYEFLINRNT